VRPEVGSEVGSAVRCEVGWEVTRGVCKVVRACANAECTKFVKVVGSDVVVSAFAMVVKI
jgi:hypothetical protein